MAKDLSPEQRELRAKARRLADAAGKSWGGLPKEERRKFLKQARGPAAGKSERSRDRSASVASRPWREEARAAAKKSGKEWRDLSKEERQKYLAEARSHKS